MGAGFEVYDRNGKLQISDSIFTYVLRQSGVAYAQAFTVGNTSTTSVSIPGTQSYVNTFIALQGPYPIGFFGTRFDTGQRVFATGNPDGTGGVDPLGAPVGTPFNYFIFQRSDSIPISSYGLEIRDQNNLITFSANQNAMRIVGYFEYNDDNVGTNAAAVGSFYSAPGRSLAFAQGAFAGHRIAGSLDYYLGGQLVSPPGPGDDPQNYQYGYRNFGDIYGCYNPSNDYSRINTGLVSFDRVYVGPSSDSLQPPNWDTPLKCFVIDVTNIPIGQQFF